jgi:hypothetical protein
MLEQRQNWLCLIAAFMVLAAVGSREARGEHAVIDLRLIGPDDQAQAFVDQDPPAGGVNPHPKLTVNAGDPLSLQFILTNVYPHGLIKDVTVRYFVVGIDNFGDKAVPDLEGNENIVTRGEATFNFKPKCRVGSRFGLRIDKPGFYLVRVDTLNTKSDHEHFAAIDLVVK